MTGRLRLSLTIGALVVLAVLLSTRHLPVNVVPESEEISAETFAATATATIMPAYPESSLRNRATGVAVALVVSDPDGRVRSVDILQAPDSAIANSMRRSLIQWRFAGVAAPSLRPPLEARGRVILYFVIDRGNGLVLTPDQVRARRTTTEAQASRDDMAR